MDCGGPNGVLSGERVRAVPSPEPDHRVRFRKRSMHVPLIAAVVGEEIIDDAIESRPVGAVVGVSCLSSRDCDMGIGISLSRGVTGGLVRTRKRNFHKRAMIGPGSIISSLLRFISRIGHNQLPLREVASPLLIE